MFFHYSSQQQGGIFPNQQLQPIHEQQYKQPKAVQARRVEMMPIPFQDQPHSEQRHDYLQRPISPSRRPTSTSYNWQPSGSQISPTANEELHELGSDQSYYGQRNQNRLPLEPTSNICRTALSTLDEFSDDTNSLVCFSSTANDSGIVSDLDNVQQTEADELRGKVAELEKENADLKYQLAASRFRGMLQF